MKHTLERRKICAQAHKMYKIDWTVTETGRSSAHAHKHTHTHTSACYVSLDEQFQFNRSSQICDDQENNQGMKREKKTVEVENKKKCDIMSPAPLVNALLN